LFELILQITILALALSLLVISSHFAISAIERLIEFTGLGEISAGFIILSVMTSTPELVIALFSIYENTPGISIGDIVGSNVFNIGAVIGILGMLGYLQECGIELLTELVDLLTLTSLIPLFLVIFKVASPIIGGVLLITFAVTIYLMSRGRRPIVKLNERPRFNIRSKGMVAGRLLLSMILLTLSARMVVLSALEIASFLGVPPILLGAKLVAIGTSLPELILDLTAARRGRIQLAIGDIIGSNLTNLTLVLGLVLVSSPLAVDMLILTEIVPFMIITTIIFWRFLNQGGVSKVGGIVLIMVYILFQATT